MVKDGKVQLRMVQDGSGGFRIVILVQEDQDGLVQFRMIYNGLGWFSIVYDDL